MNVVVVKWRSRLKGRDNLVHRIDKAGSVAGFDPSHAVGFCGVLKRESV